MFIHNQLPYPTQSFPDCIRKAAEEVANIVQVTNIIAGTSCLAGVSIAVSPLADWRHPLSGQIRPCGVNQGVTGSSGDRKSSADELVCRPFYDHDAKAHSAKPEEEKRYSLEMARWTAIRTSLLSRIARRASAGKHTDELDFLLHAHMAIEPVKPIAHRIIHQDLTRVSAFEALEGDGKAIAVLTDEGQTLLDSAVMRHYGFLNSAWDGKQLLTYDRAKHESIIVRNPRMTISFMVQPEVLASFFAKRGKIVQNSGFCARYLFARSPSIHGYRWPALSKPPEDLLPFHARIRELLTAYQGMVKSGKVNRDILEFDENAKALWLRIAKQVEGDFLPGYYLSDIRDFGNKYMDIVGRIACLLHYFAAKTDGLPEDPIDRAAAIGLISADTLGRAEQIAAWHLNEYKQLFSPPAQPNPEEIDAHRVYCYLYRSFHQRNQGQVLKNHIRQYCGIRNGHRLDTAIQVLQNRRAITVAKMRIGKSRKESEVVMLDMHYFNANSIY